MAWILPAGAVRIIEAAVERLFDRAKVRYLGPKSIPMDKRIYFGIKYNPKLSLPGLFHGAAREERVIPDEKVVASLVRNASNYLDAYKSAAKAKVVKEIQSFFQEADTGKVKALTPVLNGRLADLWGDVTHQVKRMVDTEASNARNMGVLEGILGVSTSQGIKDPVVFWITARDANVCKECAKLHLMPNGVTPRLWFLSEVSQGYHVAGENHPAVGGLHPHCRCSMVTLMPGYGFDKAGMVRFVSLDHDEIKAQRGD